MPETVTPSRFNAFASSERRAGRLTMLLLAALCTSIAGAASGLAGELAEAPPPPPTTDHGPTFAQLVTATGATQAQELLDDGGRSIANAEAFASNVAGQLHAFGFPAIGTVPSTPRPHEGRPTDGELLDILNLALRAYCGDPLAEVSADQVSVFKATLEALLQHGTNA